jgi:hypothetical protein
MEGTSSLAGTSATACCAGEGKEKVQESRHGGLYAVLLQRRGAAFYPS